MPEYNVGFGKPPKKSQWKKGQSGNPKGSKRKKPPQPLLAELADILAEPVPLSGTGKSVPYARAFAMQTMRQVLQAPLLHKLQFLAFAMKHGISFLHQRKLEEDAAGREPETVLTEEDRRMLEYMEHVMRDLDEEEAALAKSERRDEEGDRRGEGGYDDDECDLRHGQL